MISAILGTSPALTEHVAVWVATRPLDNVRLVNNA